MRDPRPGLGWSTRRAMIRTRYGTYMDSPAWYRRRETWLNQWRDAHHGTEPTCLVCGIRWTLRDGDLHHRSYQRVGQEEYRDLSPLCRACHTRLHALLEGQPSWRRLGRPFATDQIILLLRNQRTQGEHHAL
jgi:5-methylcytosine-specific restriction endonuclease McrA